MPQDITKFLSKKSRQESLVNRFTKLARKAKTKTELRELEMKLLKPVPIDIYTGIKPGISNFKKRSIRLSFQNPKNVQRLGKYIRVNAFREYNSYDLDMIITLLDLLDSKRLTWDKERKNFYLDIQGYKVRIRK